MNKTLAGIVVLCALLVPTAGSAQHFEHHGWSGHSPGGFDRGHYQHGNPIGGFLGGFLGGAIFEAFRPHYSVPPPEMSLVPWSPLWYKYCSEKYQSFNPQTGQYVGYDGNLYFCR